jgi:hypothetical protein
MADKPLKNSKIGEVFGDHAATGTAGRGSVAGPCKVAALRYRESDFPPGDPANGCKFPEGALPKGSGRAGGPKQTAFSRGGAQFWKQRVQPSFASRYVKRILRDECGGT